MRITYWAFTLLLLWNCGCSAAGRNQVLQLASTRRLTRAVDGRVGEAFISPDGGKVVYLLKRGDTSEFGLATVATGKSVRLVLSGSLRGDQTAAEADSKWVIEDNEEVQWSPDGKLFGFCAKQYAQKGDSFPERQFVMVFSSGGFLRTSYELPAEGMVEGVPFFTPDSTKLALQVFTYDPGRSILILNTVTGQSRLLRQSLPAVLDIDGFTDSGRSLKCIAYTDDGDKQLWAIPTNGSPSGTLVNHYECGYSESPDGKFEIGDASGSVMDGPGLSLINRRTRKAIVISKDEGVNFEAWSSDSRMLLYSKFRSIVGRDLWLYYVGPGKKGICVARDVEDDPSCSRDFRDIAYISQGQLCVAKLSVQQSHTSGKLHRRPRQSASKQ